MTTLKGAAVAVQVVHRKSGKRRGAIAVVAICKGPGDVEGKCGRSVDTRRGGALGLCAAHYGQFRRFKAANPGTVDDRLLVWLHGIRDPDAEPRADVSLTVDPEIKAAMMSEAGRLGMASTSAAWEQAARLWLKGQGWNWRDKS